MLRRLRRILVIVLLTAVALTAVTVLGASIVLRGSLPRLDGARPMPGLAAAVTVTRDALGVPDIMAASREDAACALGYLHAQDRFFQMDLQRRAAAGELAELLGPALLESDRDHRRHRFRGRARAVLAAATDHERALVQAYAAGVNAGLADLRVRPWEYLLLRQRPRPWRPEDTVLAIHAMFLDLSLATVFVEETLANVRDNLPQALATFLMPAANRWEAPLESGPPLPPALPDSTLVDLRHQTSADRPTPGTATAPADTAGSNNWAVAGRLTGHGGAIVANDMHLNLGLPNTWYRVRMSWPEDRGRRAIVGVTLPGTPALVAGSNGEVAWGFTNSYGDWLDLVVLELAPADTTRYRTPEGWRSFDVSHEVIAVAGGAADTLRVVETIWGPVWSQDTRGNLLALRWTAHDTAAVNLGLLGLEVAEDVDAAVTAAARAGIPPQNLVCADRTGRVAWTIAGRIPQRLGWDGRVPVSWADGSRRWDGYRDPARQPHVIDPPEGRVWTANNRVTAGADLAVIGNGGYGLGARARQIRDGLRALEQPTETDMLALQLDDRAVFMAEWRSLILDVLARRTAALTPDQTEFLRRVRDEWDGHAAVASVSYRLMREAVGTCVDAVYADLTAPCRRADPGFRSRWLPHRFAVTWQVLTRRPPHLLPGNREDWDDIVLDAVESVMTTATAGGRSLPEHSWGAVNTVRIAHPFTFMDHRLERWLAAPAQELPGDSYMPRVQHRTSGASERFVVSPGREQDGLFHMPGGQAGHPLSPYFLAGHDAWASGEPTPLLPGAAAHRLELVPATDPGP